MHRVVIIAGNPKEGSRLTGLLETAQELLAHKGIQSEWIRVTDFPPEDLVLGRFDSLAAASANRSVQEADAVIVGSPVFKASFSGALKTILDLLPQKALEGKPVLPLFIGGTIAHFLSIDYALKPVLSALGARVQLGGVFAVDSQVKRKEDGGFELDAELSERLQSAVSEFAAEIVIRAREDALV